VRLRAMSDRPEGCSGPEAQEICGFATRCWLWAQSPANFSLPARARKFRCIREIYREVFAARAVADRLFRLRLSSLRDFLAGFACQEQGIFEAGLGKFRLTSEKWVRATRRFDRGIAISALAGSPSTPGLCAPIAGLLKQLLERDPVLGHRGRPLGGVLVSATPAYR